MSWFRQDREGICNLLICLDPFQIAAFTSQWALFCSCCHWMNDAAVREHFRLKLQNAMRARSILYYLPPFSRRFHFFSLSRPDLLACFPFYRIMSWLYSLTLGNPFNIIISMASKSKDLLVRKWHTEAAASAMVDRVGILMHQKGSTDSTQL